MRINGCNLDRTLIIFSPLVQTTISSSSSLSSLQWDTSGVNRASGDEKKNNEGERVEDEKVGINCVDLQRFHNCSLSLGSTNLPWQGRATATAKKRIE